MALEWLDSGQVLHEDPEISLSNYGGLGSPLECHLRPPLLMRALKKSALNRGGEIESGVRAMTLRREGARVIGVQLGKRPLERSDPFRVGRGAQA